MRTILLVVAVLLIIGWIFGAIINFVGSLIHLLLVIAVVAIVLAFIRR